MENQFMFSHTTTDNSHHRSLYDSAKLYTTGLDNLYNSKITKSTNGSSVDVNHLHERLRELESERKELGSLFDFS